MMQLSHVDAIMEALKVYDEDDLDGKGLSGDGCEYHSPVFTPNCSVEFLRNMDPRRSPRS